MKKLRCISLVLLAGMLIGAAINTGVALWVGRHSISNAAAWSGGYIGEWPAGRLSGWPENAILAERSEELVRESAAWPMLERWDPSLLPETQPWQRVIESGWPWPAVRAQIAIPLRAEVGVEPVKVPKADSSREYRPVWPGFAYGALLFGALLLVAIGIAYVTIFLLGPLLLTFIRPNRRGKLIVRWRESCRSAAPLRLGDCIAVAWWLSPRRASTRLIFVAIVALLVAFIGTLAGAWGAAIWPRPMGPLTFGRGQPKVRWGLTIGGEFTELEWGVEFVDRVSAGWPWRALDWAAANNLQRGGALPNAGAGSIIAWTEGIELPKGWNTGGVHERRLPIHPVWAGLAADLAVFGSIAFVVILFLCSFRRGMRVRRHQCPACAYPVGPPECCTECGLRLVFGTGTPSAAVASNETR